MIPRDYRKLQFFSTAEHLPTQSQFLVRKSNLCATFVFVANFVQTIGHFGAYSISKTCRRLKYVPVFATLEAVKLWEFHLILLKTVVYSSPASITRLRKHRIPGNPRKRANRQLPISVSHSVRRKVFELPKLFEKIDFKSIS